MRMCELAILVKKNLLKVCSRFFNLSSEWQSSFKKILRVEPSTIAVYLLCF